MLARRAGCSCMRRYKHHAFDGGIFRVGFFGLNAHTFNSHRRKARACSLSVQQTEGLRVGCAGMGSRWLSRFKLIRLRRISLATLPRYGWMGGLRDGYQYIYCLPPAGVLHSQNKVIKCAAYGVAQGRGWVYEAYEVKNKRGKLRCLLRRRKKNFFFIFMM